MTPLSTIRETRFGIAMRPFVTSASDQTVGRERTEPIITAPTPNPAIGNNHFWPEEVFRSFFAVVRPSKNCGKDKCQQAQGKDDWSDDVKIGECGFREGRAFEALYPLTGVDQHKAGHRTDNDGIPERSGGRNEGLADWVFCLGRGGNNRCAT